MLGIFITFLLKVPINKNTKFASALCTENALVLIPLGVEGILPEPGQYLDYCLAKALWFKVY